MVTQRQLLQMGVPTGGPHGRLGEHVDPPVGLDPIDQVGGHALGERRGPDHQRDVRTVAREMKRCLAGRVRTPDDEHVPALAPPGLRRPGAVVDAAPDELIHALGLQAPVLDATGEQHAVARDFVAVPHPHETAVVAHLDADRGVQAHDLGPEAVRLLQRAVGEVSSANAPGSTGTT